MKTIEISLVTGYKLKQNYDETSWPITAFIDKKDADEFVIMLEKEYPDNADGYHITTLDLVLSNNREKEQV